MPGSPASPSSSSSSAPRVLGPRPLLRHNEQKEGRLEVCEEGVELLRRAGAPVRVAFAIGGSRCGKSTAGNSLLFFSDELNSASPGSDSDDDELGGAGAGARRGGGGAGAAAGDGAGFETGGSFDPVTTGVDVAVRPLPGGGALIVGDCEGAFHACGSTQNARGFGALGIVAYHLSSVLLHVSMGSIDERDIEVLGHLAASAGPAGGASVPPAASTAGSCSGNSGGEEEEEEGASNRSLPTSPAAAAAAACAAGLRSTAGAAPALVLLVNGARFDLGDAVARRLLRPPGAGDRAAAARFCSRAAIARGFRGHPALEALPACEHAAYWPKVASLRRRILESSPATLRNGLQATGSDLADRLVSLVAALNGEAPLAAPGTSAAGPRRRVGVRAAAALAAQRLLAAEPQPAAEAFYRAAHLEPLVEEIARRFAKEAPSGGAAAHAGSGSDVWQAAAATAAGGVPRSPPARAAEEALAEFDRRTAWLTAAAAGGDESPSGGGGGGQEGLEGAAEESSGAAAAGPALVRPGLVAEVRARLAERLAGINEAHARGRSQGAAASRRPRGMGSAGAGAGGGGPAAAVGRGPRRPSALLGPPGGGGGGAAQGKDAADGATPPVTPSTAVPSAGTSPQTAASAASAAAARAAAGDSTPGAAAAKTFATLEARLEEVQSRLESGHRRCAEEVGRLKASVGHAQDRVAAWARESREADRQVAAGVADLQERFRERLRELTESRVVGAGSQAATSTEVLAQLRSELRSVEEQLPDLSRCTAPLDQVRDGLEGERLARREAAEAASRAVESRIRGLREETDEEAAALVSMRDAASRRLARAAGELRGLLQDERREREARYMGLTEVVHRMRASLEASVVEVFDPLPPISPPSSLAMGLQGLLAGGQAAPAPLPPPAALPRREAPSAFSAPAPPTRLPPAWGWEAPFDSDGGSAACSPALPAVAPAATPDDASPTSDELGSSGGAGGAAGRRRRRDRAALAAAAARWAK